jgi:very-short-patch-repair endonuclease
MKPFKTINELARQLRKNQTEQEQILWELLRNRKLLGYKFLRQHPIVYRTFNKQLFFFIADFYCAEKELVIELDGHVHEFQKEYDEQRDIILKRKGLRTLRIQNHEFCEIEKVLKIITDELSKS